MREIKFRAWDKERNEMMEVDYFGVDEYITPEGNVVEKETHSGIGFSDMYMVDISDKRILMQYTGLKDKNGVEIYEGDIVAGKREGGWHGGIDRVKAVVSYRNDLAGFDLDSSYSRALHSGGQIYGVDELEVIGNIHENPEILEVTTDE